jgi:aldehyde dehydrogenase (NAD+)
LLTEPGAWKIAPALATGNVVVLKSAEQTPLSALYGAKLCKEAGFPAGTVNIVTGLGRVAGNAIAAHPKIRKVAFTGSTLVGRQIMKVAAESNLKKVTLELGGKSPHIVFADADFDKAVETVATGIFFNQGQVCTAGSRAYVEESIYPKFLDALKARTAKVTSGDPYAPTTFQGPQVSQIQCERINELVQSGLKAGATVVTGGGQHKLGGLFIEPTVIADVDASSPLHNEIFGPVLVISPFTSIEEVVTKANDTEYGLAAGLHTTSLDTALRMADELEAGTVWINQYGAASHQLPFGGYKQSGIGRENGEAVLHEYLQTKTVNIARTKL